MLCFFYDGKNEIEAVGELPGQIINEQRGTNGFGLILFLYRMDRHDNCRIGI